MVLQKGEKVHIITRRLFPEDLRRHFIGEVQEASETIARVEGYAFIFESGRGEYQKRERKRVRIISLASYGNFINVLPPEVDINELRYVFDKDSRLVVADGKDYQLDINEFGVRL